MIKAVTVYCSSSNRLAPAFNDAARALGAALAVNGWKLVYGGNNVGMMGVLADAVRAAGGKVIGVTPQLFIDKCVQDENCEELIVTRGMRDRKAEMEDRGDAFIALPGGLGTFEEIFEIICGKQLAYHDKPIVLLNVAGYYDPLLAMIDHGAELHFIRPRARELYFVAQTVDEAIEHVRAYRPAAGRATSDLSFEAAAAAERVESRRDGRTR
ncbi:MAG TPA: TIGR00730 family Rossman fold protein [Tepidisphaeraceae bacterium]|nr:TIGR00730 family Rossman fold protein [Tepidisphaeraceae bacterium]